MVRGLLSLLIVLTLTGCSSYHIVKPERAVASGQREAQPIPLSAGLRVTNQQLTGGFSDMAPAFATRLNDARTFNAVYYPTRADDKLDLLMDATFEGSFVVDEYLFPKAFMTGLLLFLPTPVVEYEHHYCASGSLRVSDRSGRQLKTYEARTDIPVRMKFLAPITEVEREGVITATNDLVDQFIEQLSKDQAFFSGLKPGS